MSENSRPSFIQRRRLEFIEWKLMWERYLNRSDIEQKFQISTPQASSDIKFYRDEAGGNFEYDSTAKAYVPSRSFNPQYLNVSADRLLLQLRAYLLGALTEEDLWFRKVPAVGMVPDIVRDIDPRLLGLILSAIRDVREVEVEYQSLTKRKWRYIAPHALAFDGHRWHVRAWSPDRKSFRDFVLSRMNDIREAGPASFDAQNDCAWHRKITLQLKPHPGLNDEQSKAIQCDYGMKDGVCAVEVRLSMAFYFIRRMNLDLEDIPPERAHIRLANMQEVKDAVAMAENDTLRKLADEEMRLTSQ